MPCETQPTHARLLTPTVPGTLVCVKYTVPNRIGRKLPPATTTRIGGWENARTMQQVYERLPDLEETARALAELAKAGGAK